MARFLGLLGACLCCAAPAFADNWPAWRGPNGDGHSAEKSAPLTWSKTENVRWKVPLPADGNSTPIVWGDRIFLTQATDKVDWPPKPPSGGPASAQRRWLMCFSRSDGKLLWQKETVYKEKESTHSTNPFCSASPVTDGERVIVSHGSAGLVCYDFEGKELWRKDVGKLEHIWGNASSPIIYHDLAIQWCGPGDRQFLLAVNKKTGEKVWEHSIPGGDYGMAGGDKWLGSWSTPIIVKVGNHDEMILGVPQHLKGFDPRTGAELWTCAGLGNLVYTSAVCSADGIVLAMSGFSGPAMAVRAGGHGVVTQTHRLWRHEQRNPQRIGSPVIVGSHAYILNETGLAQCLELTTGKDLWNKERVSSSAWASITGVGDRLYVSNRAGDTFVFAASPEFKQLAKNSIDEPVYASIAVSDGELFIRSYKHLWCIAEKPKSSKEGRK
jgi:outer membrane protein assembly factor BamB